jgi:hypothetical protein
MPLLNTADAVYLGDQAVDAVYLDGDKIYSPFGPDKIPGLVVWLDPAHAGDLTVQWNDLSGAGNHGLTVGWTAGAPSPVMVPNVLNGHPVVRYVVSQGRTRATGTGLTFDYTILYVGHLSGTTNTGRLFTSIYPPPNFLVGIHESADADLFYDNGWVFQDSVTWTMPSPWKVYGMTGHSTPGFLTTALVDGVVKGTFANGGGVGGTYALSGYDPVNSSETVDGEVAELVIYDRELTDPELAQVNGYLMTKYGLPDTGPATGAIIPPDPSPIVMPA